MDTPLGRTVSYPTVYDPSLLCPIPRSKARSALGISTPLPFIGYDLWRCYELSWLAENGCPQIALCEIRVPCESPNIIESKSMKLYLGSYNGTRMRSLDSVRDMIEKDLRASAGDLRVSVEIFPPSRWAALNPQAIAGVCIDSDQPEISTYDRDASLLSVGRKKATEKIYSHLLRTVCPVTGQPDWATVAISYTGKEINHQSALKYIASFRSHSGFHEECAEAIFTDLSRVAETDSLLVTCFFTRRGGIDITPIRSSLKSDLPVKLPRTTQQ